ncbi:hypothetical protein KA005_26500, partial [bacterium]|nr:hypothetical protein [bacterium]
MIYRFMEKGVVIEIEIVLPDNELYLSELPFTLPTTLPSHNLLQWRKRRAMKSNVRETYTLKEWLNKKR